MQLEEKRRQLIERLGQHLEQIKNVPPLAGRIIATLILRGQKGITFDQLVNDLEASKSTISNHLNHLEAVGSIQYFTICGDRKKYYTIAPGYIERKIQQLEKEWATEMKLIQEVLDFKAHFNASTDSNEEQLSLAFDQNSLAFFREALDYLKQKLILYKQQDDIA